MCLRSNSAETRRKDGGRGGKKREEEISAFKASIVTVFDAANTTMVFLPTMEDTEARIQSVT